MENLNRLTFKYHNIDTSVIDRKSEDITFKLDRREDLDLYYFKVLQIVPLDSRKLDVELYLKTDYELNDGIYRMTVPILPIVPINRIVPGYEGTFDELPTEQQYVVRYTWYEKYTKVNNKALDLYIVVVGYPTQYRWENDYTLRNKSLKFIQDFRKTELNVGINRDINESFIITTNKELLEGLASSKYPNGRKGLYFVSTPKNIFKM